MKAKTVIVNSLSRTTHDGVEETLHFARGVNVIVGRANTGKTKWLTILDFLMGERDSAAETLGKDISEKYVSARANMEIDGEEIIIERRWLKRIGRGMVYMNDEPIPARDFSSRFLAKLSIPNLRFPKGSPYAERKWPELSWRTLLRHIYRQQRFWSDIADQQFDSEQHACLMLFLGTAERLFSEEYGELVGKRKELSQLEAARNQFITLFNELYSNIVADDHVSVAPTPTSIDRAIDRISAENQRLLQERNRIAHNIAEEMDDSSDDQESTEEILERLRNQAELIVEESQRTHERKRQAEVRLEELRDYRLAIQSEIEKLSRVRSAGRVFADLQVTNCPVCDQHLNGRREEEGTCFLCKQPWNQHDAQLSGDQRIDFEEEQLQAERDEIDELLHVVQRDLQEQAEVQRRLDDRTVQLEGVMASRRREATALIPYRLSEINVELGRNQERIRLLERIKTMLSMRDDWSEKIAAIENEIAELSAELVDRARKHSFLLASDALADGMNTYLNALNERNRKLWTSGGVQVNIGERGFTIRVAGENWVGKVGGTLTLYLLMSYHYALLRLSNTEGYFYPGLLVVDFPAEIGDAESIADKENFVLEPFVELMHQGYMANTQVIAAGASFENLAGANRIELTQVWA